MQVVDVRRVGCHVKAELVGLADRDARLDARSRHPDREAPGVMVATVIVLGHRALAIHAPAELASPDH